MVVGVVPGSGSGHDQAGTQGHAPSITVAHPRPRPPKAPLRRPPSPSCILKVASPIASHGLCSPRAFLSLFHSHSTRLCTFAPCTLPLPAVTSVGGHGRSRCPHAWCTRASRSRQTHRLLRNVIPEGPLACSWGVTQVVRLAVLSVHLQRD